MTAAAALAAFTSDGGAIQVNGDKLTLTGPADVRQRHRAELVRLKPQILAILSAPSTAPATPPPTTRPKLTWQQELATPEASAILDTFWDRPAPTLYQPNFQAPKETPMRKPAKAITARTDWDPSGKDHGTPMKLPNMQDVLPHYPAIRGIHPAADIWPPFTEELFGHFCDSIGKHGLAMPLTVSHDGLLVDGRHRLLACFLTCTEPRFGFPVPAEVDCWAVAVTHNWARKTLTEAQGALAAVACERAQQGGPQ